MVQIWELATEAYVGGQGELGALYLGVLPIPN